MRIVRALFLSIACTLSSCVLHGGEALAQGRTDDYSALAGFQAILARDPGNRDALRGKILMLARLGAPRLALEIADLNPGILTPQERASLAADRTAHDIRWGIIAADTGRGNARFEAIDRALADSDAAASRALDRSHDLSALDRQLVLDRLVALRERYRMRDTIVLYEALAARPAPVPAYAKSAAASAYLYVEQPARSRDLYREALASDPTELEAQVGLFYALAENEEHEAASEHIERAIAATPQWIGAWSPETTRENPAYARLLPTRAMGPLLANRTQQAELQLRALVARAPFNMDIRTDHASSMRARGWPRTAEEELRWVLAAEPDHSGAHGERAGALLEMHEFRGAEQALASAQAISMEHGRVRRAARLWEVHNLHELIVDGTVGRSSGGPAGTRDYALDTRLYSRPLAYDYRLFAHAYNAEARFAEGTGRRHRIGGGVEYRSPHINAEGELSQGLDGGRKTGAAGAFAFTPDDHWTFRLAGETSSNATPLQANLAGIDAKRGEGEITWRAHESRSGSVSYALMDFTDGNRRDIVQARWTERLIVGPVYKLEVSGGLYTSRNTRAGAPYFNPSRDFSPTIEVANEWLQWRRYTRAFRHRLVVTLGSYKQEGFGTGRVAAARYEQEWAANDRLVLRYGVGRALHPYDGVKTARNFGYFYLNWKF
jgi:biofilm PGA synthesis protein PgaA